MSLHPQAAYCVPEQTKRVAEAAFPQGNPYMRVADMLGTLYHDEQFTELFPTRGQPALSPARLALCTVLQFAEGLSDRQAADAVRGRIDWKYVLCLELTDAGFHHTVLSEFRSRLLQGDVVDTLLNTFLDQVKHHGLLSSRRRQRTDSTHILGAIRLLNRLERMGETLRHALNTLAVCVPQWLKRQAPAAWYERYSKRMERYQFPKTESALQELAVTIGEDGYALLSCIDQDGDHAWLSELPAIQTLRTIWADHYTAPPEPVAWRPLKELVPADSIVSPYDTEARFCTKRELQWVGYKVHLTETCEPDQPHLITHVDTTPSTTHDDQRLEPIHAALAAKDCLPSEHLVDRGYTTADTIVTSQLHYGVTLVGPIADDTSWQAREQTGFDKTAFTIDWDRQQVTCPQGKHSAIWTPAVDGRQEAVYIRFSQKDCRPCPTRSGCTRSKNGPRTLMLRQRCYHDTLQSARAYQTTNDFKTKYRARAGIEGTYAQSLQRCGLRRSRYIGLAKTHLQHVMTATALNVIRVGEWVAGVPHTPTRRSPLSLLHESQS